MSGCVHDGYARNPSYWLDDRVQVDPEMDLPEALAEAFRPLARRALEQGLLERYRSVEDTTAVMRGRIREADQIKRRFGRLIPLEVRYDDFTVDVAENQILLAATHRLLRMPGLHRRTRHGLQRLRFQLADVTLLSGGPPGGGVGSTPVMSRRCRWRIWFSTEDLSSSASGT